MGVSFFYGDEDFNIEQAINEKKKSLDKNFSAMNYKVYDNPKFVDLISILRSTPMMFGNMLIVINCNDYFKNAFEDKEMKEIEEALSLVVDSLDIVFVAVLPRNEGKKLDSRRKIYKVLSKYNAKEFPTIKTYNTKDLVAWIDKYAKTLDIKLEKDATEALIGNIGNNLREFALELEKLKLMAYPEKTVTKQMVSEICISNEDIFTLADYIMCNKVDLALLEFKKLLSKKHELEILSAIQTMLKKWVVLKMNAKKKSPFELSRLTGMHEYQIKLQLEKMKDRSLKDLINLKQNLLNAEYKIKTGISIDAKGEIVNAIVR